MHSTENSIDQLNSFLRGEISAVETYRQACTATKADSIKGDLLEVQRSHERRVQALRDRIAQLGGSPVEGSGAWGTFAKLVQGGADLFGDRAAIAALEEGEDRALRDYRNDLDKLDPESRQLVERELLPEEMRTHGTMSSLKAALR